MNESVNQKELWTQKEVADYFRVTANTVKNWRQRGLLSFFKAPGSSRVLYYRQEIETFQATFTKWKAVDTGKKRVSSA